MWSIRGLLDFNLLFGEWPDSLPKKSNEFQPSPGYDAYAQLKEGYPWFHKEDEDNSSIMVLVERLKECPNHSELRIHRYSARAFHGFGGEFPFQEFSEKHDYSGYESLDCMDLVIRTGVEQQKIGSTLTCSILQLDSPCLDRIDCFSLRIPGHKSAVCA